MSVWSECCCLHEGHSSNILFSYLLNILDKRIKNSFLLNIFFMSPNKYNILRKKIFNREVTYNFKSFCDGLNYYVQSFSADYVTMCKRSVPDFDQCLINSIETLRPHLAKGKCLQNGIIRLKANKSQNMKDCTWK